MLLKALILAASLLGEPMMLYIVMTNHVVSVIMVVERKEGKAQ
jgi:hypothetical protein